MATISMDFPIFVNSSREAKVFRMRSLPDTVWPEASPVETHPRRSRKGK